MKNLIYDCFKYAIKYKISISVIVIFCFNIVLFGYQFKLVLEPIYGQAMNMSAATNDHVLNAQDQNQVLTLSSPVSKQILPSIKITSVSKGQQVPVGELEISGISSDSRANQCDISVMLNRIKPYQHVIPEGHGGSSDFSKWKYSFTPQYGTINKGMNKITAKISCPDELGPDLTKFNSVNIIGTSNSSLTVSHQLLNSESTTTGNRTTTQLSTTQLPGPNGSKQSIKELKIENHNPNSKSLSLSFNIDRDPVIRGHVQTINVGVYDSNTNARIVGAKVTGLITDSFDSVRKEFTGTTNTKGELSYSWTIPETGKLNDDYKVKVDAIANGYPRELFTTTFKVRGGHNSDTPFILAQSNGKFNDGLADSINDFTQGMLDNIQQNLNTTRNE